MNWEYIGDIDLKYGGLFISTANKQWGYATVIEVIDLESAIGAEGLILIEEHTVITDDPENSARAWKSCGDDRTLLKDVPFIQLVEVLNGYGFYDTEKSIVLVTDNYFGDKASWEGWQIDREESVKLAKQYNHNLRAYITAEWL
jgi:hypothetical protein